MSLSTELSGVQAAQVYIDTVGNNIANVDTTGFKLSNPEFADLYGNPAPSIPGQGVQTASLAQSFAQGQIAQTGNPFDVAIGGNGYFQLQTGTGVVYSRDGSFQLDKNGNLSTATGAIVLGYSPSVSGSELQPIQVSTASIPGSATANLSVNVNLPTGDTAVDTAVHPFALSDPASYNESTSISVYDTLGTTDSLTTYYTQVSGSGAPPQWQTNWALSSASGNLIASGAGPNLTFDTSGRLLSGSGPIAVAALPDGAAPLNIALDYAGSSLSNLAFGLTSVTNDGSGSGEFTGVTIAANGGVIGQYSNGAMRAFGTIALANFTNPQGLVPLSGNVWTTSDTSGPPLAGAPGTGSLGTLEASALEGSNVDLTTQLVNLIVAQQAYQANVQGINIEQQDFQKLMTVQ